MTQLLYLYFKKICIISDSDIEDLINEELFPDVYTSSSYAPSEEDDSSGSESGRGLVNLHLPRDELKLSGGKPNMYQPSTSTCCQSMQAASRPEPLLEEHANPIRLHPATVAADRPTLQEINVNPEGNVKSSKRVRHVDAWKQNIRKKQRNSGQTYTSRKGVIVEAKQFKGGQCPCPSKCHEKISEEQCKKIFTEYYKLADHNLQTSFLNTQVKVVNKQRRYTQNNSERRQHTRLYSLVKEDGGEVRVCKTFFKNVVGGISDGRITRALSNKNKGITPPKDKRGLSRQSYKKTPETKQKR